MRSFRFRLSILLVIFIASIGWAQVPTLVGPDDSAFIPELPVTLNWSWNSGQAVTQYQVQVDDRHAENTPYASLEIDTVIVSPEINESLIADQPALNIYFRYFWKVRAYYEISEGQYEWSEWTDYRSFTIDCQGRCGDANGDGRVNISDCVYIVYYVFNHGNPPRPVSACGDANSDAKVNVSDAVYLIGYIFVGGGPPRDCSDGSFEDNCCHFVLY